MKYRTLALAVMLAMTLVLPASAKDNLYLINGCYKDVSVAISYTPDNGATYKSFRTGYIFPGAKILLHDEGKPVVHTFGQKFFFALAWYSHASSQKAKRTRYSHLSGTEATGKSVYIDGSRYLLIERAAQDFGNEDSIFVTTCISDTFD